MKLLLKITILSLFCISAFNVFAQVQTPIDGVTIDTDATSIKPGQNVSVFVESYSFDLNASSIVWLVDGKVYTQGVGIKEIKVKGPKMGVKTSVAVNIKGSDGREVRKALTIVSNYVDIIWESSGYTPPFFSGKVPYVYQNSVKVIAVPHLSKGAGTEIDPKTLVYSWKLGGKYIENGQGYGKQSVVIAAEDLPKTLEVSVEVSNREQTHHTTGIMTLEPTEPSVSFYEEDSLYGILFNKLISGDIDLKNSEMKVLAIPFGFNINDKKIYNWSVNNSEQPNLINNRSITIRTKGDVDGSSNIDLDLRNDDSILQGAQGGFTVNFSKKTQ